jgi:hypothetical protein
MADAHTSWMMARRRAIRGLPGMPRLPNGNPILWAAHTEYSGQTTSTGRTRGVCARSTAALHIRRYPWPRALAKQQTHDKDHHDSQQCKNQRIRKPPLTPVGEPQTKANNGLFLSCRLLLSWHVHTRSFRFGNDILRREGPQGRAKQLGCRSVPDIVARVSRRGSRCVGFHDPCGTRPIAPGGPAATSHYSLNLQRINKLCCGDGNFRIGDHPAGTQRESNKSCRVGKMLAAITNPFGPSA